MAGFIDGVVQFFSKDTAIDLGTSNTIIAVRGGGIVLFEPSVIALHRKGKAVLAVGSEAKRMVGKTPDSITVTFPLADGVISDFDAAEAMLQEYMKRLNKTNFWSGFTKPRVAIGIPSGVTEVERRAVQSVARSAGAGNVYLVDEAIAAAAGSGISIEEPEGRMVVDIGGGTAEIAVLALGNVVTHRSIRVAGNELDETIVNYVRVKHGVLLGKSAAERVKIEIGSAYPFEEQKKPAQIVVRGRNVETGLPKSIKLSSAEIREALSQVVRQIVAGVVETIEETPPDLAADILKNGIVLSGGTAQLRGLAAIIMEETRIETRLADDPQKAVVRGCLKLLERTELLKRLQTSENN